MLLDCLDGLTEEEARVQLVPSRTTLLGLVKHGTFVEKVWFREAPTSSSRSTLGIAPNPDESFKLEEGDNIASVIAEYREEIAHTHQVLEGTTGETVFPREQAGRCPCAGSSFTCCVNWRSTADTRTSCANKSWPREMPLPRPGDGRLHRSNNHRRSTHRTCLNFP